MRAALIGDGSMRHYLTQSKSNIEIKTTLFWSHTSSVVSGPILDNQLDDIVSPYRNRAKEFILNEFAKNYNSSFFAVVNSGNIDILLIDFCRDVTARIAHTRRGFITLPPKWMADHDFIKLIPDLQEYKIGEARFINHWKVSVRKLFNCILSPFVSRGGKIIVPEVFFPDIIVPSAQDFLSTSDIVLAHKSNSFLADMYLFIKHEFPFVSIISDVPELRFSSPEAGMQPNMWYLNRYYYYHLGKNIDSLLSPEQFTSESFNIDCPLSQARKYAELLWQRR